VPLAVRLLSTDRPIPESVAVTAMPLSQHYAVAERILHPELVGLTVTIQQTMVVLKPVELPAMRRDDEAEPREVPSLVATMLVVLPVAVVPFSEPLVFDLEHSKLVAEYMLPPVVQGCRFAELVEQVALAAKKLSGIASPDQPADVRVHSIS